MIFISQKCTGSETYHKATTGMFYPPHKVAEKVLDPDLMADLRETVLAKQHSFWQQVIPTSQGSVLITKTITLVLCIQVLTSP